MSAVELVSKKKEFSPIVWWRFVLFSGCLLTGISALAWQSYQLITEQGSDLQKRSQQRIERSVSINSHRGTIFDATNQVIAIDVPEYVLAIDPQYFFRLEKGLVKITPNQPETEFLLLQKTLSILENVREVFAKNAISTATDSNNRQIKQQKIERAFDKKFKKVSNVLNVEPTELLRAIQVYHQRKPDSKYIEFPLKLSAYQATALEKIQFKPLIIKRTYNRSYPHGEVFSSIIGYLRKEHHRPGSGGIEKLLNNQLSGTLGKQINKRGLSGETIAIKKRSQIPVAGEDIYLTLDNRMQFFLNRALRKQLVKHKANSAMGILIEVPSGDIKAIVSQPNFNPNNLSERTNIRTRMRTMIDRFAPGSTQKPLLVTAALDADIIQENTTYNISRRFEIEKDNYIVTENYRVGKVTVTDIVKYSINVGMVKIALQTPRKFLWDLYYKLGYHADHNYLTGSKGADTLAHFNSWSNLDYYVRSYGYREELTLLEVANFYVAIANNGVLPPVRMLKNPPQSLKDDFEDAQSMRVVSSTVSKRMLNILQEVVESGSGRLAQVENYKVAGKTGTAKKVQKGQYRNLYRASFVGIIPADKPQYVLAISIEEPKASQELFGGSQVAAPVFSEVMTEVMKLNPPLLRSVSKPINY